MSRENLKKLVELKIIIRNKEYFNKTDGDLTSIENLKIQKQKLEEKLRRNKIMQQQLYRIKTKDGHVVRQKATRPYIAGFVNRDIKTGIVVGYDMTTKPKHLLGTKDSFHSNYIYEELVAVAL